MARKIKKNAVIVYPVGGVLKIVQQTRNMMADLGFTVALCQYQRLTEEALDGVDVVVITTPENLDKYDKEAFAILMTMLMTESVGILGLGDINSYIMDYMSYDVEIVSNHKIGKGELHNIVSCAGDEFYLPSSHLSVPVIEEYNIIDLETFTSPDSHFLDVIAISPTRDIEFYEKNKGKDTEAEVEIFGARDLPYLAIMGAPELFYSSSTEFVMNKTSAKTMEFIDKLITNFFITK